MEDRWTNLFKGLQNVETAANNRDVKACSQLTRLLASLRRTTSLPLLAGAYQNLYGTQPEWSEPEVLKASSKLVSVEVELYLSVLVVMHLVHQKRLDEAISLIQSQLPKATTRTAQPLLAKLFFYLSFAQEVKGEINEHPYQKWYREACLRHDSYSQATLLNVILRILILRNQVDSARQLAEKTEFPSAAPHAEVARNQYYIGRIAALQLNYSQALTHLTQAMRKAPEKTAAGFKLTVQKLSVLVELLTGEVPSRKTLVTTPGLQPYIELVSAVRLGELEHFQSAVDKHAEVFKRDLNMSLVLRLRHLVIKSGLRRINIAYSAINLHDVSHKLGLPIEGTEFIVAKAIRDGTIEASIEHEEGVLRSKPLVDHYQTNEPQAAFSRRIAFCLELRNDAVRGMQFPQEKQVEAAPSEDLELTLSEEEDDL
jgi:26S proteasome regulatory subunit N3